MTTWWVRPDASHGGTNAGTSYANAWQGWAAIVTASLAAGDTINICGTFTINGAHLQTQKNGSAGSQITYYGAVVANDLGVFAQATAHAVVCAHDYCTFDSITFNQSKASYILSVQGAGTDYGIVRNCTFDGQADIDQGLIRFIATVSTQAYTGWLIETNTFIGSARAGIEWFPTAAAATFSLNKLTIQRNVWESFRSNNNGGCISFRTSGVDVDKAIMTDIVIEHNAFTNCEGLCIRFGDQGATSTPTRIDIWSGVKIRYNTITGQLYHTLPVAGRPVGGWQTGGGIAVTGFGPSATAGFGQNEISHNMMYGLQGITGGINSFTGRYWIHHNVMVGIETRSGIVDGNGVLVDYGSHDCLVTNNYVADALGDPSNTWRNSGMAYGTIGAANITFSANVSKNTRHGLFLTDGSYVVSQPVVATGNTFLECVFTGIYQNSDYASVSVLRNNLITGTGVSFGLQGTGPGATSGGYSILMRDESAHDWSVERNNLLYGFPFGAWDYNGGDGLGSTYTIDVTDLTINPLVGGNGAPLPTSPAIAAGVFEAYGRDYAGIQRPNPPSIGAYDLPTQRRALDSDPSAW